MSSVEDHAAQSSNSGRLLSERVFEFVPKKPCSEYRHVGPVMWVPWTIMSVGVFCMAVIKVDNMA